MKITIMQPTRHDGRRYAPGEKVDVSKEAGAALIGCGAAEAAGRPVQQDQATDLASMGDLPVDPPSTEG